MKKEKKLKIAWMWEGGRKMEAILLVNVIYD